ncbi:VOC family protein [Pendulispora rubella]|uniref:VOC family protein n=1 Tax=Pendulispora rubella TaxID=2741070 RepID=A0ABZ2KYN0_9BACT
MSQKPVASRSVLGVHSLDHFGMVVPDIGEARRFFEAFGFDVRSNGGGIDLRTFGRDHTWVTVRPAPTKSLQFVAFGAYREDMEGLYDRVAALAVPDLARDQNAIRFKDPDGLQLEVIVADKSSPDAKSAPAASHTPTPPGTAAAPLRSKAPLVQPRRLAHILLFVNDIAHTIDFYCKTLGLRLSDKSGDVAFLHGPHGSDHHMIAFVQRKGPGLHHSSWDVGSVQEVGLGAMQMADAGYGNDGWGLGRHVLGSNYFHYVRDPWNSYAEYSFDIDYVPAGVDWPAGDHHPDDGFYLWGPKPPKDFDVNYELR